MRVHEEYIHYLRIENRTVPLTTDATGDVRLSYTLHSSDTATVLAQQIENRSFAPWLPHADMDEATIIFVIRDEWVRFELANSQHTTCPIPSRVLLIF